jgi:hypothetical protein
VVVHTSNPSTQEVEAGGSTIQGQAGLHREIYLKNKTQRTALTKEVV